MKTNNVSLRDRWLPVLLVIVACLLAGRFLLMPGYFAMHDDLQVTRFYEMEKCIHDGQIPCRWVPDMGAGRGFPLFNYYAPLPYYIGVMGRWIGMSFMDVVKATFLLGTIGSGLWMYVLVSQITRSRWAGVVAAVFYVWAPYRSVDVYVRGALSESWALMWFPMILWSWWMWAKSQRFWYPLAAASTAALFLSHNIMSLWFAPVIAAWVMGCWWQWGRSVKKFLSLVVHSVWAVGLAAFFLMPAMMEKHLVHSENLTQDYFDFRNHFVTIKQLFIDRSWGYGPSRLGPVDDLSFQIGWPHWWLLVIGILVLGWALMKRKSLPSEKWGMFTVFLALGTLFFMHARSVLLWEAVPILAWTQFPWRILALTNFALAGLAGWLVCTVENEKYKAWVASGLMLLCIALNWQYFQPDKYNATAQDADKLTGTEWNIQKNGAIRDYLPMVVETYDIEVATEDARATAKGEGTARIRNFTRRSNFVSFDVEADDVLGAEVEVELYDYPEWIVLADGVQLPTHHNNPLGLITFEVTSGKHIINMWFMDTQVRTFANLISLASYALWLGVMFMPMKEMPTNRPKL